MSNYMITDTTLTSIADAIRSKTGGSSPILVEDFANEIDGISGGGITVNGESLSGQYSFIRNRASFVSIPHLIDGPKKILSFKGLLFALTTNGDLFYLNPFGEYGEYVEVTGFDNVDDISVDESTDKMYALDGDRNIFEITFVADSEEEEVVVSKTSVTMLDEYFKRICAQNGKIYCTGASATSVGVYDISAGSHKRGVIQSLNMLTGYLFEYGDALYLMGYDGTGVTKGFKIYSVTFGSLIYGTLYNVSANLEDSIDGADYGTGTTDVWSIIVSDVDRDGGAAVMSSCGDIAYVYIGTQSVTLTCHPRVGSIYENLYTLNNLYLTNVSFDEKEYDHGIDDNLLRIGGLNNPYNQGLNMDITTFMTYYMNGDRVDTTKILT